MIRKDRTHDPQKPFESSIIGYMTLCTSVDNKDECRWIIIIFKGEMTGAAYLKCIMYLRTLSNKQFILKKSLGKKLFYQLLYF